MTGQALIYIFFGALTSTLLYVILRYYPKFNVNNLHALTANYFTASLTSFLVNGTSPSFTKDQFYGYIPVALLIGILFITVFYTAALTAQRCGVAITSIAGKMSMVIPISAGIWWFGDHMTILKITGIALALAAVYCSTISGSINVKNTWLLPLLLFLGSGIVDTAVKFAQEYYIDETTFSTYISMMFGAAGVIGTGLIVYNSIIKHESIKLRSIIAGIILGITNYFSLHFLVLCLAVPGIESSLVFAVVNLSVVLLSALFAFFWFKEKPTFVNITGLALAIIAIIVLYLPQNGR